MAITVDVTWSLRAHGGGAFKAIINLNKSKLTTKFNMDSYVFDVIAVTAAT